MLDPITSLSAFCAMVLASYGIGRPIVRGLGIGGGDRLSTGVWSLTLGLIVAGLLLAVLGLLGLLYSTLIGIATMSACFWGIGEILVAYELRQQNEGPAPRPSLDETDSYECPAAPWQPPAPWLRRTVLGLAAVACLGSLVVAMAPPTAGDALCYHLELPKSYLAGHSMAHLPYNDNSTFPLMTEMWFLWGMALEGPVAAQLVHWGLGVLLGLATVVLASPVVGRSWAWMAGAIVLLVPGVGNQMTAPLCDVALAAMTTLCAAAWWRAAVDQQGRQWFVVAGLTAGAAMGIKYIAAIFAVAVAAHWLWCLVKRPAERRLLIEGAAVVAVVAASVGGLWYVRAAWYRGNPVYPFASEWLASNDAPPARDSTLPAEKSPLGRSPFGMASAPWQITMHPERFGGRGHQLGVVFLGVLPGLFSVRRLRGLGVLMGVAAVYGLVWYLLRQNVRFLLPVVPLLSVAVVWVWIESRRFPRLARTACAAVVLAILTASAAVAAARSRDCLAVAVGVESRDEFLTRREPTYPAALVANLMLDQDARILSQECRTYYFQRPIVRESIYRRVTKYDRDVTDPAGLAAGLRQAGFTHLLLAENNVTCGVQYDDTLSRLAGPSAGTGAGDDFVELTAYSFRDSDGAVRNYRLLRVRPEP